MYSWGWAAEGAGGAEAGPKVSTGDEATGSAFSLPLIVVEKDVLKSGLKLSVLSTGGSVGAAAMVAVLCVACNGKAREKKL